MNKTRQGSREKRVEKIAAFCMDTFLRNFVMKGGMEGAVESRDGICIS